MERTLPKFVWTHSWRAQLLIVAASFLSFPLILAALYIPKEIVNNALGGTLFPVRLLGREFEQLPYLFTLCGILLVLIFLNNGVKYFINIQKGLTGERLLRRLRYTIYERISRLPLKRIRNISSGEVVQVVAAEVEPIGSFAGEIVATPVYMGGQLLVYMGFIVWQDPVLGLAAMILFPVQAYVIPKVQRIVVRLVQARIRNVRQMTGDISETVAGIEDMRLSAARHWHLARLSERLYTNFRIRYRIFVLKYAIKFANNVINNITPFFFYSFGGYLVIQGRMDLGALVAILAAYKDIASPWRELLNYYQSLSDISARYEAVVQAFGAEPLEEDPAPVPLHGRRIRLEGVQTPEPRAVGGLRDIAMTLEPGRSLALIGEEEAGRGELIRLLAGLTIPEQGEITAGEDTGREILSRAMRDIAMVTRVPHVLRGTVRDNLAYSLMADEGQGEPPDDWARRQREAVITGATPQSPDMDWVDYARVGLSGADAFDSLAVEVLTRLGLEPELFARGLSVSIDPNRSPDLARAALGARRALAVSDRAEGIEAMVEHWAPNSYLENFSLAENLFFGVPDHPCPVAHFACEPAVRKALRGARIEEEVVEIGLEAARTLQELTASLGRETALLDQIGLIEPTERDDYARIVANARRRGARGLGRGDRDQLIMLALQIVPMRHRLGVLDDPGRRSRLVAARGRLRELFRPGGGFTYLDTPGYVAGLPLIENILRGRPRIDRRDASPPIEERLDLTLAHHNMHDFVLHAGLRTEVGLAGNTLSPTQRRMIALGRALLSRPALLLLDAIADDRGPEQVALRRTIREILPETIVVYGTLNADLAQETDAALRVAGGRVERIAPARDHAPLQTERTGTDPT